MDKYIYYPQDEYEDESEDIIFMSLDEPDEPDMADEPDRQYGRDSFDGPERLDEPEFAYEPVTVEEEEPEYAGGSVQAHSREDSTPAHNREGSIPAADSAGEKVSALPIIILCAMGLIALAAGLLVMADNSYVSNLLENAGESLSLTRYQVEEKPYSEEIPEEEKLRIRLEQEERERLAAEEAARKEEERRAAEEAERLRQEREAFLASLPGAVEIEDEDDSVTFVFSGDVLFDESYATGVTARKRGIANCFDEQTLSYMRDADICMINNEFAYTDRGTPLQGKTYTLHASTDTAAWLHDLGVDIVGLANNHVFDYGEAGFLDTLDTLAAQGIPYVGAGRDINEASAVQYYVVDDMVIAIVAATQIERYPTPETRGAGEDLPGVFRCYDGTMLYQKVREAKETADYVIAFLHWGTEKENIPEASQINQAKELQQAGCDLIIGGHPHRLQTIDFIEDMPVFYSMGNYFFTSYTVETGLARITLKPSEKTLEKLEFLPMMQTNTSVRSSTGAEKEHVLNFMRELSPNVLIDEEGVITKK